MVSDGGGDTMILYDGGGDTVWRRRGYNMMTAVIP
jgi:hypothetical protein